MRGVSAIGKLDRKKGAMHLVGFVQTKWETGRILLPDFLQHFGTLILPKPRKMSWVPIGSKSGEVGLGVGGPLVAGSFLLATKASGSAPLGAKRGLGGGPSWLLAH